jgi:hypothetical protein
MASGDCKPGLMCIKHMLQYCSCTRHMRRGAMVAYYSSQNRLNKCTR